MKVPLPSDKFRAWRYLTEAEGSSCFNSFSNLFNSLKHPGKLNTCSCNFWSLGGVKPAGGGPTARLGSSTPWGIPPAPTGTQGSCGTSRIWGEKSGRCHGIQQTPTALKRSLSSSHRVGNGDWTKNINSNTLIEQNCGNPTNNPM